MQAPPSTLDEKISEAKLALDHGERLRAYQLSLEATQAGADNYEAWFVRSESAPSLEEEMLCLSRAQSLRPKHPVARRKMYQRVKELLEQDPFLAYVEETQELYRVRNYADLILAIPKDRAVPETFPVERPKLIEGIYRRLMWAVLGLFLSGLGAVVFAPMAAAWALRALGRPLHWADRTRAGVALIIALLVFVLGAALVYLLWLHLVG